MNTFQIVLVVLAVMLVASAYWQNIVALFQGLSSKPEPKDPDWLEDVVQDVVRRKTDLMMIVACWDNLRELCDEAGLDQASEELTHIWPLLVDGGNNNVEIS